MTREDTATISPAEKLALLADEGAWTAIYALTESVACGDVSRGELLYYRSCAAARLGLADTACAILSGLAEEGWWFSELVLRQSPSFAVLQGRPDFEALVERHAICQANDCASADPRQHWLGNPRQGGKTAIVIHGNSSSARREAPHWSALEAAGFSLLLPESDQGGLMKGNYVWNDGESAVQKILDGLAASHCGTLADTGVFAGFSIGAQIALRLALAAAASTPAGATGAGLILFEPYTAGAWVDWLRQQPEGCLTGRSCVVAFAAGTDYASPAADPEQADALGFLQALGRLGVRLRVETFGDGHYYPADFSIFLHRSLLWLEQA